MSGFVPSYQQVATVEKTPSLVELAERVVKLARQVEQAISKPPTLVDDTMRNLPAEYETARQELIDTSGLLNALARGGGSCRFGRIISTLFSTFSFQAIDFIYRCKIAQHVPDNGDVSYGQLAQATGVPETWLRRVLRVGMTIGLFYESRPGRVAHTADTRDLKNSASLRDFVGSQLNIVLAPSHELGAYLATPGRKESDDPVNTAFCAHFNTQQPFHTYLEAHPHLFTLFSGMMTHASDCMEDWAESVSKIYPWDKLPAKSITADLGGGNGHTCARLAQDHPDLVFRVMDLDAANQHTRANLSAQATAVEFVVHDFFKPMPCIVQVCMFMQIFHNWSDSYCKRIISALVPACQKGTHLLIIDRVVPESDPDTDDTVERTSAAAYREILDLDLVMLQQFNAQERSLNEFRRLVTSSEPRFVYEKVYYDQLGGFGIIDFVWTG